MIIMIHSEDCTWQLRRQENSKDDGIAYYNHVLYCLGCHTAQVLEIKNVEHEEYLKNPIK